MTLTPKVFLRPYLGSILLLNGLVFASAFVAALFGHADSASDAHGFIKDWLRGARVIFALVQVVAPLLLLRHLKGESSTAATVCMAAAAVWVAVLAVSLAAQVFGVSWPMATSGLISILVDVVALSTIALWIAYRARDGWDHASQAVVATAVGSALLTLAALALEDLEIPADIASAVSFVALVVFAFKAAPRG